MEKVEELKDSACLPIYPYSSVEALYLGHIEIKEMSAANQAVNLSYNTSWSGAPASPCLKLGSPPPRTSLALRRRGMSLSARRLSRNSSPGPKFLQDLPHVIDVRTKMMISYYLNPTC